MKDQPGGVAAAGGATLGAVIAGADGAAVGGDDALEGALGDGAGLVVELELIPLAAAFGAMIVGAGVTGGVYAGAGLTLVGPLVAGAGLAAADSSGPR